MPGKRPVVIEEIFPPYAALLKRQEIARKNTAGNYQPGDLPPLTNSKPLSLAEQLKQ